MIHLLYGDEEFLVQEEAANLRAGLGSGDMMDLNTARLDGATVSFPEFEAAVCSIPFLADCRVVLVQGLLSRFGSRAGADDGGEAPKPTSRRGKMDAGWDGLADLLTRLPETTQLLVTDGAVDSRNPLLKAFTPAAKAQVFKKLKGAPLADWVRERIALHRCKIDPTALRLLLNLAGENLRLIDSEVQKLALYANGAAIDEDMVRKLVPLAAETTVFALVDACSERRLPAAQRELHRLMGDGAAPTYILFMLARQVRMLLQARELMAQRMAAQDMMKQLGVYNDWAFRKTMEQAQGADTPTLVRTMTRLLEADVQMKTGQLDPALALELLVTELCGAPARR